MTKRWLPFRGNTEHAERIKRDYEAAMKIEPIKTIAETAADYVAVQLGITRARLTELNKRREAIDEEVSSLTRVIEALEAADEKISGNKLQMEMPLALADYDVTGNRCPTMAHHSHEIVGVGEGDGKYYSCLHCNGTNQDNIGRTILEQPCESPMQTPTKAPKGEKHE